MFLTVAAVLAQAPVVPSQLELNGFLLGQHGSVVEAAFGEPLQVHESPDGWVDRVFFTDTTKTAYMAFGFAREKPDYVASIQLTGRYQDTQIPFLGLRLGAPEEAVKAVLGPPTERVAIPDWVADRWEYAGRNYTVEVDTAGQLFSIRLTGYGGLGEPAANGGLLRGLRDALAAADPRAVMMVLAPDFELYRDGEVHMYRGPALTELADSSGRLWTLLVTDPTSLKASLLATDTTDIEMNVRVLDSGLTGMVFKFPEESRLSELFFVTHAGRWVLWEIAYR